MVSNTSPSAARGLVSTALALCIASSAAVHAQDIGGSTWNGWTDRGSSVSTGVYANGGLANDYQVYTAVFLYNPSNPIPGTTSGFTAGHKILAVGIRNNASTLGTPVLLLDSGNDSFFPAASTSTTGNSSFDFDASTGDSKWSFFLPGSGLSDLAIRNQSGTDYVATSTGDWGTFGAPGVRGTNPATGVWKVFIDLNQVFSEYGALGSRGANPGLAPLGSSVAIALSMFEASAAPAETGTEAVVRNLSLNTAPVGTNDTYSMDEDTTLNAGSAPPALGVLPLGVLSNDTDAESDVLTATLVTGLVIEAMRNSVSVRMGVFAATSWKPTAVTSTTLPSRAINVTIPPASLRSTKPCMPAWSRLRRSVEMPTETGVDTAGAGGACWAETA